MSHSARKLSRRLKRRYPILGVFALIAALLVGGWELLGGADLFEPHTATHQEVSSDSALAVARTLEVKGRAPKTGYSREQFGPAWKDVDKNGCDQRNDILNRDLVDITHKPGTGGCIVLSGTLHDPFSAKTIHFERGQKTSQKVQIDHVVALSDAWQKGAQQWDQDKREAFANDPLNLLAVDGPLNGQKGDADAATWLPPNKPFRCEYVAQLVGVKHAYSLWVTRAEQNAMVRELSRCQEEPLPQNSGRLAIAP